MKKVLSILFASLLCAATYAQPNITLEKQTSWSFDFLDEAVDFGEMNYRFTEDSSENIDSETLVQRLDDSEAVIEIRLQTSQDSKQGFNEVAVHILLDEYASGNSTLVSVALIDLINFRYLSLTKPDFSMTGELAKNVKPDTSSTEDADQDKPYNIQGYNLTYQEFQPQGLFRLTENGLEPVYPSTPGYDAFLNAAELGHKTFIIGYNRALPLSEQPKMNGKAILNLLDFANSQKALFDKAQKARKKSQKQGKNVHTASFLAEAFTEYRKKAKMLLENGVLPYSDENGLISPLTLMK